MSEEKIYKEVDLFGNEFVCIVPPSGKLKEKTLFDDYDGFVDKFEAKKTTDDCYTPPDVYDLILKYVASIFELEDKKIIRPFLPNGDYINVNYSVDCVIIDNPPFSLLAEIVKFYNSQNIKFFLFAPHMTLLGYVPYCSCVVAGCDIVYDNGAKVKTSFLTNMFDETKVVTSSKLYFAFKNLQIEKSKASSRPVYKYPDTVCTVSSLSYFIQRGFDIEINNCDFEFIRRLDSQKQQKKGIFGSGLLLSEAKAKEAKAKEASNGYVWELSEKEIKIVESLGNKKVSRCSEKKK